MHANTERGLAHVQLSVLCMPANTKLAPAHCTLLMYSVLTQRAPASKRAYPQLCLLELERANGSTIGVIAAVCRLLCDTAP
eukprot:1139419-Pelagomonas_calceolata.AAC.9